MPAQSKNASEVIEDRIAELRKTKIEVARQAGLSDTKLRQIQRGETNGVRRSTFAKIAGALGWETDDLIALLEKGKRPIPSKVVSADTVEARLDRIEGLIVEILQHIGGSKPQAPQAGRSGR